MNTRVLSASTLNGDTVYNTRGEELGTIEDFMLDLENGRISYAVLSFGGFLGLGDKLFAVPTEALQLDTVNERFVLDVNKETLKDAPGFDKDNWPRTADRDFLNRVYTHYGYEPTWDRELVTA
ncbi:MAG: PRC-barrel domain-containing protein [Rhodothermales bacterium]|nr:PRC-barrel domain-containing protein [Rhodothermales bacterium]